MSKEIFAGLFPSSLLLSSHIFVTFKRIVFIELVTTKPSVEFPVITGSLKYS